MVQSIDLAISLVNALANADRPLALRELGFATRVPSSAARRLLPTPLAHCFVRQDVATGLCSPGTRPLELAYRAIGRMDLRSRAGPVLDELNAETGMTVHLAILDGGEVVHIDNREANEPVRMHSAIGKRAPVHCTALGKALIAFLEEAKIRSLVKAKGLPRFMKNTITTVPALLANLRLLRERGFSRDNAEQQNMIHCIGAPIRDHASLVVANLSLTGTVYSPEIKQVEMLAPRLIRAANAISHRLGWTGAGPRRSAAIDLQSRSTWAK